LSGRRKARVLVVEDDPGGRELLEHLLGEEGYTVESESDGAEAWRRLEAGPPPFDVALLDWALPGIDGLELLGRIKAAKALEPIPVIFQTARTDREAVLAAVAAGVSYFVPKPIDSQLLRTVVAAAVADHARRRALHETAERGEAAAATLVEGSFRYRTILEATSLATLLSRAFPDPERSLTGLSELMINAVEHGNLGITYQEKSELLAAERWSEEVERRLSSPEHRDKQVEVRFERTRERIVVEIADRGAGFDWRRFLTISTDRIFHTHGRGIAMANLMSFDRLEYVAPGNRVLATVELGEDASKGTGDP
jgi:CheY-like chemotaxis protein/anti-sigma regulatory factor (Ser/Thr protein kinase)